MLDFKELSCKSYKAAEDIYSLAISAKKRILAIGHFYSDENDDKTNISIWDLNTNKKVKTVLKNEEFRYPRKICFYNEEELLILHENDNILSLNTATGETKHIGFNSAVDLALMGARYLAISGISAEIWDVDAWNKVLKLESENMKSPVLVQFGEDNNFLYIANMAEGKITIASWPDFKVVDDLPGSNFEARYCKIHPNEHYYYCQDALNSGEHLWDIKVGNKIMTDFFNPKMGPGDPKIDFHKDLPLLARGASNGIVMILNIKTEKIVSMQTLSHYPIRDLVFDEAGRQLIVASGDGFIYMLDIVDSI